MWVLFEEAFFLSILLMKLMKWLALLLVTLWIGLPFIEPSPMPSEFPFVLLGIWAVTYCLVVLVGTYSMHTNPDGNPLGWLLYMVITGGIATVVLLAIGLVVGLLTLIAWLVLPQFPSAEVFTTFMVIALFEWHHYLTRSNLGHVLRELSISRV